MKGLNIEMRKYKSKECREWDKVKTKVKTKIEHKKMNNTHKTNKQTQIDIPTSSVLKTPGVGLDDRSDPC